MTQSPLIDQWPILKINASPLKWVLAELRERIVMNCERLRYWRGGHKSQILKRGTQKSDIEEEDTKDDTRIILNNEINSMINICLITADPDK